MTKIPTDGRHRRRRVQTESVWDLSHLEGEKIKVAAAAATVVLLLFPYLR